MNTLHTSFRTAPLDAVLGADIADIDVSRLDEETFDSIRDAWIQHSVLRFRQQNLSDVDLMNFSRRFGELDSAPAHAENTMESNDPRTSISAEARGYVTIISNVLVDGLAIGGLGNHEAHWHTDMSYLDAPPTASALFSVSVPPEGGNTSFACMYMSYEDLDDATKKRIANLTCVHDRSRNSAGELRRGFTANSGTSDGGGARHPLVCRHPESGHPHLFLGRRRNAYIPELPERESAELLDYLWHRATLPEYCWTQVWKPGDLVVWDNRCTMHRRDAFDNRHERIMHRTQICGEPPLKA